SAPKAPCCAPANWRKTRNDRAYGCPPHLRVARQRGRKIFSAWRKKNLPQGPGLRSIRAERTAGDVSVARAYGAGFSANPRTGRQSPPRLLRAATLVLGPGGRARTQTAGGCSLAETSVLSRIGEIESGRARSIDFVCFNVYLHHRKPFENYLARLQMLADTKPLVLGEFGVDSIREGEERQGKLLAWQVEAAFGAGLAGTVIFSFTDDWFR